MGTKNNPGAFDCYKSALPDEPMFVLLARDRAFEKIVRAWTVERQYSIFNGDAPETDSAMIEEALECAFAGARWRRDNNGIWRAK